MTEPGDQTQPLPQTQPIRISAAELSVVQPSVYEGRGSSKALHRVVDRAGRVGLYKEYKDDVVAEMDTGLLTELVAWPSTLTERARDRMLPQLAHPFAVVMAQDRACGVVMPEAPERFFYRDRRGRIRPRTIDTLSTPRRMARQNNSPFFEPPHRLALLGRLLILVSDLHDAGVVVGDLQPQNILVSGDPLAPAVKVLDCDSFWLNGRHAFGAPTDPETWRSPWMGASFTNQTDLFKLALLVTRCMQEDNRDWFPKREVLTQFMPTHQVERLEGLLAKEVTVSAQQLRGLAGNWRARVGANGTLYNSTDAFLHAPWTPPPEPEGPPPWGAPGAGPASARPHGGAPHRGPHGGGMAAGAETGAAAGHGMGVPSQAPGQLPAHVPGYFAGVPGQPSGPPPGAPVTAASRSTGVPAQPGGGSARLRGAVLGWVLLTLMVAGVIAAAIYGQGQ